MLSKSRAEKRQSREPRLTEGGEAFMPDDRSVAGSTSTWGVVNIDPSESGDPTDELRAPSSRLPWAISMSSVVATSLRTDYRSIREWRADHKLHCPLSGTV
jgi:1-phosphatidylinositol-3-phosphate 5-kinase